METSNRSLIAIVVLAAAIVVGLVVVRRGGNPSEDDGRTSTTPAPRVTDTRNLQDLGGAAVKREKAKALMARLEKISPEGPAPTPAAGAPAAETPATDKPREPVGGNEAINAFIAEAELLPEGQIRAEYLLGIDPYLTGPEAIEQAIDRLVGSTLDPGSRELVSRRILRRWTEFEPEAAAIWAKDASDSLALAVVAEWAAFDPVAAATWSQSLPTLNDQVNIGIGVVKAWGAYDPSGLYDYFENSADRPGEAVRNELAGYVAGSLMPSDPDTAWSLIDAMPTDYYQEKAVRNLALRWGDLDPAAAIDWLRGQATLPFTDAVVDKITRAWADSAPDVAAGWAYSQDDAALRAKALGTAITAWAKVDPGAAIGFALGLPEGPQADDALWRAVTEGVVAIAPVDPRAAAELGAEMIEDFGSLSLAGQIAWHWGGANPVEASEWVGQLEGGSQASISAVAALVTRWYRTDPEAVGAWIDQMPDGQERDLAVTSLEGFLAAEQE